MQEIKFAQMAKATSPNPVSIIGSRKEDGSYSLATVSWWMPLSYAPDMFAAAINHGSFTAERIRETGRAVLAVPAAGAEGAVIGCGTTTSREKDKASEFGIEMAELEGTGELAPAPLAAAVVGKLVNYQETGDHNLYVFEVEKAFADEEATALFAWNGYMEIAPAAKAE